MENTTGHDDTLVLPYEIIVTVISNIIDTKTVLSFASTSKKNNILLHSKQFWCQNGGVEFNKYAAYWNDQIPSHIVAVIVYIKSLVNGKCSCVNSLDQVLSNLISKLSTSYDMTDIEDTLMVVEKFLRCDKPRCNESHGHRIILSGLAPKYVHFLSDQFTPAIQVLACWTIHRLCSSGIHYANVVVQENGVIPLIELMMRTKELDCVSSAAGSLVDIVKKCPYTADEVLNILLEPSLNLFDRLKYNQWDAVVLLAVCVTKSTTLDPLKILHIIPPVIDIVLPKDGPSMEIGIPFVLFARIMVKSHRHPAVVQLIVNDALINAGLELMIPMPVHDEVFEYFTELLRYDASLVKKMKITKLLTALSELDGIQPVHMTFLTQLLEDKKTQKKMIKKILKYRLIAKSMKFTLIKSKHISILHAFLKKFFLVATDEQIQKSITWRAENVTSKKSNKFNMIDIWNQVLSYSPVVIKRQKTFKTKVRALMMHWHAEMKQNQTYTELSALNTLLQAHYGDVFTE